MTSQEAFDKILSLVPTKSREDTDAKKDDWPPVVCVWEGKGVVWVGFCDPALLDRYLGNLPSNDHTRNYKLLAAYDYEKEKWIR